MYGLSPGNKVGPYVLDGSIGAGGQGSVWRAHHESVPGSVALKVIPVRGSPVTMVERVRRETEALVKLGRAHPSVVACQGLVEDDASGVLAVAMEMVEGEELSVALQDPRCDLARREAILLHVAKALAFLHQQGIVHRDVKPQNILVQNRFWDTPDDPATVKLVDFGIATVLGNPKPLTEVGTVVGTPAFMPPERIDPMFWETASGRPTEDVFAFGVVAYEAFFGRHPSGVKDDGTLSVYAEKYRAIARSVEAWPQLPPGHRWSAPLRGALTLKRADRIPDGAALVAAIGAAPPANAPQKTQADAVHEAPIGQRTEAASIHDVPPGAVLPGLGVAPGPGPAPMPYAPSPYAPSPMAGPPPGAMGPMAYSPPPPMRSQGGEATNTMVKALIGVVAAGIVVIPIVFLVARRGSDTSDAPPPTTPDVTASSEPIPPPSPPPTEAPPIIGNLPPIAPPVAGPPPKPTGPVVVGPPKTDPPATTTATPPPTTPPTTAPPTTTTGGRPKIGLPKVPPQTPPPTPPTPPTGGRPKIKTRLGSSAELAALRARSSCSQRCSSTEARAWRSRPCLSALRRRRRVRGARREGSRRMSRAVDAPRGYARDGRTSVTAARASCACAPVEGGDRRRESPSGDVPRGLSGARRSRPSGSRVVRFDERPWSRGASVQ